MSYCVVLSLRNAVVFHKSTVSLTATLARHRKSVGLQVCLKISVIFTMLNSKK